MKVKELIKQLQKVNPNRNVFFYKDGFNKYNIKNIEDSEIFEHIILKS